MQSCSEDRPSKRAYSQTLSKIQGSRRTLPSGVVERVTSIKQIPSGGLDHQFTTLLEKFPLGVHVFLLRDAFPLQ